MSWSWEAGRRGSWPPWRPDERGAQVTLVEGYGHLGGLWTGGLVLIVIGHIVSGKRQLCQGIGEEMMRRLEKLDRGIVNRKPGVNPTVDAEALKYVMAEMVMEGELDVFLHCWGVDAIMDGNKVCGAVFETVRKAPGYEDVYLMETAPQLGVRISRVLDGLDSLKMSDVEAGTRFPDVVAVGGAWNGDHQERQIPYGALVRKNVDNILAAGRCISGERFMSDLIRVIPNWCGKRRSGLTDFLLFHRFLLEIGYLNPAGLWFFAVHVAMKEVDCGFVGVPVLVEDAASAEHPRVLLLAELVDHLVLKVLLEFGVLRVGCQIVHAFGVHSPVEHLLCRPFAE